MRVSCRQTGLRPWLLRIATVLLAASGIGCGAVSGDASRRVSVDSVGCIRRLGSAGAEAELWLRNDSGRTLVLRRARIALRCDGLPVGTLELHAPVRIARRSATHVVSRWRVRSDEPMAFRVLERRLRSGDLAGIEVGCDLRGRSGVIPANISTGMMPLSDFLNTFGLSADELKQFLE